MSTRRHPRGQVVLITAFAMIALLAIAAIVVDLGFSWMLHRKEQNAADPGAVAAAKWIRDTPTDGRTQQQAREEEACFYAQINGFFERDISCATALASGNLDVNYPPATALAGQFRGHPGYVEVVINATHPSFFGQFFGQPFGTVRTAAVAALTTGNANSSSLVALGDNCSTGGAIVSGGGMVTVHPAAGVSSPGGYINVNAPCGSIQDPHLCDAGGEAALKISGGGFLKAPHAFVVGGCATNGGGTFQCQSGGPCLDEQAIPLGDPLDGLPEPWTPSNNLLGLPIPACPGPSPDPNTANDDNPCVLNAANCPVKVNGLNVCTMNPGVYYAGWDLKSKVRVDLKPGMYVLAGGGIKITAQSVMDEVAGTDANGNTIAARVTIFSTDGPTCGKAGHGTGQCEGSITISSSGPIVLKATDATTCAQVSPRICPWKGILIWQDASVNGTPGAITFNGSSTLDLAGTIYAPKSYVTINGANSTTGCSATGSKECLAIQVISWGWKFNGGSLIDMPYDPAQLYHLEQRGLVH